MEIRGVMQSHCPYRITESIGSCTSIQQAAETQLLNPTTMSLETVQNTGKNPEVGMPELSV